MPEAGDLCDFARCLVSFQSLGIIFALVSLVDLLWRGCSLRVEAGESGENEMKDLQEVAGLVLRTSGDFVFFWDLLEGLSEVSVNHLKSYVFWGF